jgi:hypothetical protein
MINLYVALAFVGFLAVEIALLGWALGWWRRD